MTQWKIISEKSILKAKLFEVKEQEVLLPDNTKHRYEIVERRSTINIFPLTDTYDVYLISQYRSMFKKRVLEAVSGHIDIGETSISAAKRELSEEVGMSASQWEEIGRIEMSASVIKHMAHIFIARDLEEGKPKPDAGEDIALVKITLKEAVEKVMTGEINIAATIVGILLLDRLKSEKKL